MITVSDINKLARILGGVPVFGCIPGSPSHRAGIRFGDILLSANGLRISNLDTYVEARERNRDSLSLVIFRDGKEQCLELALEGYRTPPTQLRTFFEENQMLVAMAVGEQCTDQGSDCI